MVGEKDDAELEDGASASLAEGDAEKERVPEGDENCGNVTVFVATSIASVIYDDREIPSAIESTITTT